MNFEGHRPNLDTARSNETEILSPLQEDERALLRQALLTALVKEEGETTDQSVTHFDKVFAEEPSPTDTI